jgi:hypothetical protein
MPPFSPIKKRQAAKVRQTPSLVEPGTTISNFAGEAAAADDHRAEMLALVPQDCRTPDEFIREITNLWRQTKARFLLIGRYLIAAKERWPHGEYERNIQERLPFGPEVARQIKAVAEAVYLKGRLQEEELPSSYSIAYHLTTLSPEQLSAARSQSLLREDLKRREIIAFKKATDINGQVIDATHYNHIEALHEERRRLLARLDEIEREIAAAADSPDR